MVEVCNFMFDLFHVAQMGLQHLNLLPVSQVQRAQVCITKSGLRSLNAFKVCDGTYPCLEHPDRQQQKEPKAHLQDSTN